MIFVMLGGRCGNQLFIYAFVRKLQIMSKQKKITIVSDYVISNKDKNRGDYWENSLLRFKTVEFEEKRDDYKHIIIKYGDKKQKCVFLIYKFVEALYFRTKWNVFFGMEKIIFSKLSKFGIYSCMFREKVDYCLSKNKNIFIRGAFEDGKWFDDIRANLLEEIVPKNESPIENNFLYSVINNQNSVCVSLRKWDIDVSNENSLKIRQVCDRKYYEKAIKKIKELVENPVFIVFSDDVRWAEDTIKDVAGNSKVYAESGIDDVAEKLKLMSSCKHFILANSTFSWWAQYLCLNDNKIVIAPDRWFNYQREKDPLISDDWILIKS